MTVEVQLQVTGVDLRDEATQARIQENLPEYAWAIVSGITTMTVYSDGDVVADICQAIRCAQNLDIQVLRVYEDRVNVGEIARRIGGFSREAVRKWTLDKTFPLPRTAFNNDSARGSTHMWDWAEVNRWLKEHKGLDLDEELPTETDVAEINAMLAGVHDYASTHWHWGMATGANPATAVLYRKEGPLVALSVSTADWHRVAQTRSKREPEDGSHREYA